MRYTRHIKKISMKLGTIEFGACVLGNSETDESKVIRQLEGESIDLQTVAEDQELFAIEHVDDEGLYDFQVFRTALETRTFLESAMGYSKEDMPALPDQAGQPLDRTSKRGRCVVHYQGTADFPCRVTQEANNDGL